MEREQWTAITSPLCVHFVCSTKVTHNRVGRRKISARHARKIFSSFQDQYWETAVFLSGSRCRYQISDHQESRVLVTQNCVCVGLSWRHVWRTGWVKRPSGLCVDVRKEFTNITWKKLVFFVFQHVFRCNSDTTSSQLLKQDWLFSASHDTALGSHWRSLSRDAHRIREP